MKLTNQKFDVGSPMILYKAEANAIVAVVLDVIDNFGISAESGTFMLWGVKNGECMARRLISFDFDRGPTYNFYYSGLYSHAVAEDTLVLDASREHDCMSRHSAISYYIDTPPFLRLWAEYGRFTCAFYAGSGHYDDMARVYCAVVQAFALMCEEDEVLQNSCDEIFYIEARKHPGIYDVRSYVKELFKKCELPELVAWKYWHKRRDHDRLKKLFFE